MSTTSTASASEAPSSLRALRTQSAWTQLGTLFLVELSNWRWTWTTMLLRGTITPLLSLIALGVFARDSGGDAVLYVVTGNVVVGLLFGAMDAVHSHITFLRFDGAMDYFATLPISKHLWILAMTGAFQLISLPSLCITLLVGPPLLGLTVHPSPLLVPTLLLCALSLSGVGALLGLVGRTRGESLNIGFLLTLVMSGLGPVLIPPDRLPKVMRGLGYMVPSTYAASAVRQTLVGPITARLALDIVVLLGITSISLWWVGQKMTWRAD
jgi:ABC-2 type transport system permease protein